MLEVINKLHDNGIIKELYVRGLVSSKLLDYRNIVNYLNAQIKQGIDKTQAITNTADHNRCSEGKVYRAMRAMRG